MMVMGSSLSVVLLQIGLASSFHSSIFNIFHRFSRLVVSDKGGVKTVSGEVPKPEGGCLDTNSSFWSSSGCRLMFFYKLR